MKQKEYSEDKCSQCLLHNLVGLYLDEATCDSLCNEAGQIQFRKGEMIMKQGSRSESIGFLHRGIVKFVYEKDLQKSYIMTVVSGPKLIGQANLFFRSKNIFSIVAIEDCEVCLLDSRRILDILAGNGKLLLMMAERSTEMFQTSIFNFISLAHHQVIGRVAEILLFLWETVYRDSTYDFTLSRKEIAEFAACSHENVINVLSRFKKDGYIALEGKRIRILDVEKLKEISKRG